ncbi:MAG: inverse autotransporter beta domain-containing protein [Proteobacteria bacterium]|nr:inverse autotransporter beta domain-containing protein [Pseudomonadota bacterium]MBU1641377.1 inverse autotransporter beta domain-containing protein [Pseudomonadota bacterium]
MFQINHHTGRQNILFLGKRMTLVLRVSAILALCFPAFILPAHICLASGGKWQPHVEITAKPGTDRTLGKLDLFVPLAQSDDTLLFADLRGVLADDPSHEGNFGLGLRRIQRDGDSLIGDWLWGAYGFYDYRHSENNFSYGQATFGAEAMTENFSLRGNYYLPENQDNIVAREQSLRDETELSGTQLMVSQENIDLLARERALPGFDLEAGARLALQENHELWAHGGYFRFDHADTPVVEGPRLRLEYRWEEPFAWQGTRLSVGGEIQHDDIRGDQGFGFIELRIPLGAISATQRQALKGIDRRMTEQIVRDIDIVVLVDDITKPVGSEGGPTGISESSTAAVTDSSGGQVNVYFVREGGSGDCSQAQPCDLVTVTGHPEYGEGDAIVLLDSGGAILGSIALQDRQQLVGSGAGSSRTLTLGDINAELNLSGLGGRAQLDGGAGTAVTLANETLVSGFDISAGATGIDINGTSDGAIVSDLNISGTSVAVNTGAGGSGTVTFQNNVAINSGAGTGLQLAGGASTLNFAGDITGSGGSAFAASGGNNILNYNGSLINNSGRLIDISGGANSMTFSGTTSVNGGTGITIANSSGNTDFNNAVDINNANGSAIRIGANTGTVAFGGTTSVSGSTGTVIDLSGSTGTVNFGAVDITNLSGVTGVSTVGSSGALTMASLDITGTGAAGSKGVDITGSTGSFTISNGGTIQNVITGFDLDSLGTGTTNSTVSFLNGTINAGVPVNTVGITNGTYNFAGSTITKNNALSTATGFGGDFIFVDRTGGGTGTSTNRASADFAETNSQHGDIIALVNDGTGPIIATGGFTMQYDQQLIGFGAGDASVDFTGSNSNVLGNFLYQLKDPTGNGSATLTNSGGSAVITLASNTKVRDFNLTTSGAVDGIAGSGFYDATINNMNIANAGADAFDFNGAGGMITISNSSASNAHGAGLRIYGGSATYALNNFDISDDISGRSVDIQSTTGGSATFDAASTITNTWGSGLFLNNLTGNVTFNGAVNISWANTTAVTATDLAGNTVAFNGGLAISSSNGNGLTASDGTLSIAGTGTAITATGGSALDLNHVLMGNGSGGALTFANLYSDGSFTNSLTLTNTIGSLVINNGTLINSLGTAFDVNGGNAIINYSGAIYNSSGRLLDVLNSTGGSVTVTGTTISDSGSGIRVQNSAGNVAITNADLTQANVASVTLSGNSGDFTMTNGSVNNSGGTGVAVQIDNTSGAISFNGTNLTQTSGRLIDIGATTGPIAGSITFSGGTLTGNSGSGIRVQNTAADVAVDGATLASSFTDAVTMTNNSGSFTLSNSNILNTAGAGILGNTTSDLTFDNVTINDTATSSHAISLTDATGTVNLLNSTITYDAALATANGADGLDIDNFSLGAGTLTLIVDNTSFTGRGDLAGNGLRNAIDVVTSTTSTLDATITGSSFVGTYIDGVEIDVHGTGGGDSLTIGTSANRNTFTGVGGDVMDLSAQNNSTVTFDIRGNDADGNGLSVSDGIDLFIYDGVTATVDIIDNSFTDIGDDITFHNTITNDDIAIKLIIGNTTTANSAVDITVSNNTSTSNNARGLVVDVYGNSDARVTVNDNIFSSGHLGNDGVSVVSAIAGTEVCLTASGNSFLGGEQITLTEECNDGSILRLPGTASAVALSIANGNATVNDTNANVGFNEACTIP